MPVSDLDLLIDAAKAAGEIATPFAGQNPEVWDKPDDAGPVTEADLAVNRMLEVELQAARPDYGWLSEESDANDARLQADHVFIVDPIDGTRSFIKGETTWAHSLAIAHHGQVTAAVVYLPLLDKMYIASLGQGAFLNGDALRIGARAQLEGAEVLAARPAMDEVNWAQIPQVNRSHRPSLAYRLSLVAEGRFDAMLTLRKTWEWDVAAGDLIIKEAGGVTSDKTHQTLKFNNADPRLKGMIASNPDLHPQILAALV